MNARATITRVEADYLTERFGIPYAPGPVADVPEQLYSDSTEIGIIILEKVLGKPLYICAKGETSAILLNDDNERIQTPIGHRRGDLHIVGTNESRLTHITNHMTNKLAKVRIDPRIIVSIAPNPKRPSSGAYARYQTYSLGKSIDWHYKNASVNQQDVRWDSYKGFIRAVSQQQFEAMRERGELEQEVLDGYDNTVSQGA